MDDWDEALAGLETVRDWLRYAVTRFGEAELVYGHGTSTALDEAAFIILECLGLDVAVLEPWLDAKLLPRERRRIAGLIRARIETRKPAPYLVGAAYIRGRRFVVDERAIIPRSYIAELLCDRMDEAEEAFPPFPLAAPVQRILDLCTGGGSLAILAAEAFPDAAVDAVDLSPDALALARINVERYGLGSRIDLIEGDLFAPLAGRIYDLVLTNPPYVTADAVSAFPPEYAAEPVLAHLGGTDGLDLARRILADAGRHLAPDGQIVLEVGMAAPDLMAAYPDLPFVALETAASAGEVLALPASALHRSPSASGKGAARRRR